MVDSSVYNFLQAHLETCPARILLEQSDATVHNAAENPVEIELPPPSEPTGDNVEESWDDVSGENIEEFFDYAIKIGCNSFSA